MLTTCPGVNSEAQSISPLQRTKPWNDDSYSPLRAFARSREIHFTVDVADGECGKGGPWLGAMFEFGIAAN
jgi:hypothetical protein